MRCLCHSQPRLTPEFQMNPDSTDLPISASTTQKRQCSSRTPLVVASPTPVSRLVPLWFLLVSALMAITGIKSRCVAGGFLEDLAKQHDGRSMRATSTMRVGEVRRGGERKLASDLLQKPTLHGRSSPLEMRRGFSARRRCCPSLPARFSSARSPGVVLRWSRTRASM